MIRFIISEKEQAAVRETVTQMANRICRTCREIFRAVLTGAVCRRKECPAVVQQVDRLVLQIKVVDVIWKKS